MLRAGNRDILSTNKGYLLFDSFQAQNFAKTVVAVKHSYSEVYDEFATIVELGGRILDVSIDHDLYGQIQVDLVINDLNDAKDFVKRMNECDSKPLKCLTGDIHYHTIAASSDKVLDLIKQELRAKNFLLE